jgi:type I restriction enzyme R subunit
MRAEVTMEHMLEQAAIGCLIDLLYPYVHGWELSPESGERESYQQAVLKKRFLSAARRLNPWLSGPEAGLLYNSVAGLDHGDFSRKGMIFHDLLVHGLKIKKKKGKAGTQIVRLIDFENVDQNDFLCANQYTVEGPFTTGLLRRSDLVIFVNGLPVVLFEFRYFKAQETAKDAFYDHKKKKADIPQLYAYAQILVASDGLETKYGTPTSDWDRFLLWEGVSNEADLEVKIIGKDLRSYVLKPTGREMTSYEVLLEGLFRKENLLEYLQDFAFYEKPDKAIVKDVASFHHFYLTRKAIEKTKNSVLGIQKDSQGTVDRRIGVVWHSLDKEKMLAMLLYARKALKLKEIENPLLLFLTDREDFKEQMYKVFAELPAVTLVDSLEGLHNTIKTAPGGMVIAPIKKFTERKEDDFSILSDRRSIVVIADEAYRKECRGFVRKLKGKVPNASFIGFTAGPIKRESRSTTLVFGGRIGGSSMDKRGSMRSWSRFILRLGFRDLARTLWGCKTFP